MLATSLVVTRADSVDVVSSTQVYLSQYAIGENLIHVYRLSDAHHWSFTTPPELFNIQDITYVDSREVWVWVRGGVVRQPISELGPGDPAP